MLGTAVRLVASQRAPVAVRGDCQAHRRTAQNSAITLAPARLRSCLPHASCSAPATQYACGGGFLFYAWTRPGAYYPPRNVPLDLR